MTELDYVTLEVITPDGKDVGPGAVSRKICEQQASTELLKAGLPAGDIHEVAARLANVTDKEEIRIGAYTFISKTMARSMTDRF